MPLDVYNTIIDQRLAELRGDFFPRLQGRDHLTLEIGCGHGHYLTAYAEAHPHEYCVGIDLIADRLERAERKTSRVGRTNVAWVQAEASLLVAALPDESVLRRIFVLFPDPWPKRRHWKNRLIQTGFLDLLAAKSAVGAQLCFRTDHVSYFTYAYETIRSHPLWELDASSVWPFELATVFQQRASAYQSLIAVRKDARSLSAE
jgi:tRNA (guanine-N7-)-methyltransferase